MKPTWLIERGVFPDHQIAFKTEVERQGMTCVEVDYQPGKQPPADIQTTATLPDDACAILWGTLPLMQQIKLTRSWIPGGWCNVGHFECSVYYSYFGRYLLNNYYTILPGVEAIRLQDQLFEAFGSNDEVFVRPSGVLKTFTGKVVYREDFRNSLAPSRYDSTNLVVISEPKEIGREWRLVIADDEIVASSQYRDQGVISFSRGSPEDVKSFASDVLRTVRWRPDPVFIMDVCESEEEFFVVELNSFSCSGLYDCDLTRVIKKVSNIAEKSWIRKHSSFPENSMKN